MLPDNIIRYEVASKSNKLLTYRVGHWRVQWAENLIRDFSPLDEQLTLAREPWFRDVSGHALSQEPQLIDQFSKGVPYWRARLDPASGIDIYGSNGIAVGDVDGDGLDEIYVCQPGGLPNRLLKVQPDGRISDITRTWGVDLLDDTSCALFVDLRNCGKQDLVVLRSSGPVLFVHEGQRFRLRTDAFQFAQVPKGGFTGMAAADFDRDGKLDLYLCCYVYFHSEAQYTYATPYHDARNGPPNFLFRNRIEADGTGAFVDCTSECGMDQNNDRFSFAPAWCDYDGDGWPDLFVANDFGRKNLYHNHDGKFRDVAAEAGVEDIGPGMSASWFDYDGDGRPDIYVANMWTDVGQRVVADTAFKPAQQLKEAYRSHTMGNSLFQNQGDGRFRDVTQNENAAFGRWAWASGGHDLDNDGKPEILVTCGMLTNESETDLKGFFWRKVVAKSPTVAQPSTAYENGWNAINQFVRETYSWNGHEPNVMHVRRGDRYFDFSGLSGFDFADDSRAFAVCDFDGDGRPDILLKSRLGPQVRILQNNCAAGHRSIAFRLRGTRSNRDAIGAKVEVDGQTKWLAAGSEFLSQHSKRLMFGLGAGSETVRTVRVTWPSGLKQEWTNLASGRTHVLLEGSEHTTSEPFREHQSFPEGSLQPNNTLSLQDTWFLTPIPLPVRETGPKLYVVGEIKPEFEIFRRYLFDWRTDVKLPLALLLNSDGDVVKVYGSMPRPTQVGSDLAQIRKGEWPNSLPFPGYYVKQPKRDYFKFGAAYLWAGMFAEAVPYLARVLEQTPDNPRVLILMGQVQLDMNRPVEAKECFTKAAKLDPGATNAFVGLGDIAARSGQLAEASQQYATAFRLDSNSAEAANGLGLSLAKQGRLSEAQQYLQKAIELRPDYADAINNLAVLYAQQGKLDDAIAAWNYGIKVAPDVDILYMNLGRTYVSMGRNEKARLTMQQLLDRDANNETARRALQELSGR